jgi:novobiocin biosynthesis protein NovU/D-mycarose 3-C-methyltransferase
LVDLGTMPPANWLQKSAEEIIPEFPLALEYCRFADLQLRECVGAQELYSDYLYVTPNSTTLNAHYQHLIEHMLRQGYMDESTRALEIGSNRGAFLEALRPHVTSILGVDAAANICQMAEKGGIPTICGFFSVDMAQGLIGGGRPALVIARHCLAHNEDPHVMLAGISECIDPNGVLLIENNYAVDMIANNEFDQIYHEHMFYFTLHSLQRLVHRHGLRIIDAFVSAIHGGSIVCFVSPVGSKHAVQPVVVQHLAREEGFLSEKRLHAFVDEMRRIRHDLLKLLNGIRSAGKQIMNYGATAKSATLMNFVGLTRREITACADSTLVKQGRFLPKSGIPVISEEQAFAESPDYFLLTAWNYKDELIRKVRDSGLQSVRFILPIPKVTVL